MKRLIVAFVFFYMLCMSLPAQAIVCPNMVMQCLPVAENITDRARFRAAGARSYEIVAWQAISSGNIGKGPFDIIDWSQLTTDYRSGWWDIGYFHLAYRPGHQDVLGIGIEMGSPDWLAWSEAALYEDRANWNYAIQLEEWRRKTRSVSRIARRMCDRDGHAVALSIGNSSPTLSRRLIRETACNPRHMLTQYATTPHRRRRAEWLENRLL